MPIANFKCIRDVSSEDSNYSAGNLLKHEPGKKWKTKSTGEKSAYIIFELNRPMKITGIDIGNEHSAFVEVLVSNSGFRVEDFKEILITCSFMTPFESKNSTNPNRVRCFGQDALVQTVALEKYHLIKVICTQPFNKHVQYGLSFVKVHVMEDEFSNKNVTPASLSMKNTVQNKDQSTENGMTKPKIFAKFALREESPDSESESSVALFNRWKKERNSIDNQPTTAANIRQASSSSGLKKLSQSSRNATPVVDNKKTNYNTEPRRSLDRNRNELAFDDDEDEQDEKLQRLSKYIESDKQRLQNQKNETPHKAKIQKKQTLEKVTDRNEKDSKQNSAISVELPSCSRKRHSSPQKRETKKLKPDVEVHYRPFNQLLKGVVFVISGIQNPDRANLRSKALSMGAKYKADWEPGCTHLICAFKNTPKYIQVKAQKGKIVTRHWIEKCFDLKKYLPWRRYALDSSEQALPESDTEILDESFKPEDDVSSVQSEELQPVKLNRNPTTSAKEAGNGTESNAEQPSHIDSGSDTDDYIEDIKKNNIKLNKNGSNGRNVYELSTEEEDFVKEKDKRVTTVPTFFHSLKFYIHEDIKNGIKDQLTKCIKHYGGSVESSYRLADYFVSESLPEISFSGEIVKPQWVFECNDMEQKVGTKPYLLIKR